MKDWLLIALAALILLTALALPFGAALALTQEEQQLWNAYESGEIIRLHVLAHSDAAQDQAVKLRVRDAVIERFGRILSHVGSAGYAEAQALLRTHQADILQTAENCLKSLGSPHRARVEVGRMHLPPKRYGQVTLPEGEYFALRIVIGSGEGENWWCVLFPQLCLALSETPEEAPVWHSKRILQRWLALPV